MLSHTMQRILSRSRTSSKVKGHTNLDLGQSSASIRSLLEDASRSVTRTGYLSLALTNGALPMERLIDRVVLLVLSAILAALGMPVPDVDDES